MVQKYRYGERDICVTCYQKRRRAPPNGCVISVWHWCRNTETGEIDIYVVLQTIERYVGIHSK